jgi:hypothetical protein
MTSRTARAPRAKKHLAVVAPKPVDTGPITPEAGHTAAFLESERRKAMIEEAAYYRAAQRGFEPGRELEDWCAAENDIDTRLARGELPTLCGE